LASPVMAAHRRGALWSDPMDHGNAYAALACVQTLVRDWSSVPGEVQVVSCPDRRTFYYCGEICRAQCFASKISRSSRRMEVVECLSGRTTGCKAHGIFEFMADGSTAELNWIAQRAG